MGKVYIVFNHKMKYIFTMRWCVYEWWIIKYGSISY